MSLLSIAQTALAAAQLGLSTTANNVSNASTPGYDREQIIQTEAGGQNSGFGFIGAGTDVSTIQRTYSSFLTTQVNSTQASYSSLNTGYTQISQINNMFASSTSGLSPALQSFYNSVQTATANPNTASSLENVLSCAQTLASQFQSTGAQLNQIGDGVNSQITSTVQTINGYATQIASLNEAIQTAEAISAGQPPNGLLDQRDEAIANLSQQVGVTVVNQGNDYNVFVGSGQPLVVGANAYQLTTVASPTNVSQLEVGYVNRGATTQIPDSSLTGGALGGLLQFRSQSLVPAENAVGQMAIGLASTVNAQQALGQDQSGNVGAAMFTVGSPTTTASANNTGIPALQITTSITNASALTTGNYSLQFDGTNYNLTNLSDNAVVYSGAAFPPLSPIDGLSFTTNGGTPAAGDSFLIQPTATGASGFGVAITNTSQIAMAAPIVTNASTNNTGNGQISAGVVNSPGVTGTQWVNPLNTQTDQVSITFNAPAGTFNATDLTSGTTTNNVSYVPGDNITYNSLTGFSSNLPSTAPVAGDLWTVQISGTPAAGDTFTVKPNISGTGDSRNGLLIAALQTTNTLNNGTSSVQGAYSTLVSLVGNQTAELQATSTAANTQLTSETSAQQSLSGVNLDEEASNLLQYQQAYQAAAQVMSAANTLFTSLMTALSTA